MEPERFEANIGEAVRTFNRPRSWTVQIKYDKPDGGVGYFGAHVRARNAEEARKKATALAAAAGYAGIVVMVALPCSYPKTKQQRKEKP